MMRSIWFCNTVSIHAPRVGSDLLNICRRQNDIRFNPRPPSGERLTMALRIAMRLWFQSTPPEWGATCLAVSIVTWYSMFQSTPPEWGAT